MKYKIQIPAIFGWADLKSSKGEGYETELFNTKKEAQLEIEYAKLDLPEFEGRVVPEATESDGDLY